MILLSALINQILTNSVTMLTSFGMCQKICFRNYTVPDPDQKSTIDRRLCVLGGGGGGGGGRRDGGGGVYVLSVCNNLDLPAAGDCFVGISTLSEQRSVTAMSVSGHTCIYAKGNTICEWF